MSFKENIISVYLQQCIECNNGPFSGCVRTGVEDGPGVPDADYVLYVSAVDRTPCGPNSAAIAFAQACEMEQMLDR